MPSTATAWSAIEGVANTRESLTEYMKVAHFHTEMGHRSRVRQLDGLSCVNFWWNDLMGVNDLLDIAAVVHDLDDCHSTHTLTQHQFILRVEEEGQTDRSSCLASELFGSELAGHL